MECKKQSMPISIMLHLVPGMINAVAYFLFVPIVTYYGFPNTVANYLMVLITLIPMQLGILFVTAHRKQGTYNFLKLIPWLKKSRLKEYLIFIPIMAIWAIIISAVLSPLETRLLNNVFAFIPSNMVIDTYDASEISRNMIIFMVISGLITNGLLAPIMEEIYFRGYLLPRIDASKKKAVVLNAVLFSLYHFFTPWAFFSRVLMMIPLYWWVAKKENIRFSIIAHIIANSLSILVMLL